MTPLAGMPSSNWGKLGAVAQMGERRNRTAEARGSIPLGSTKRPDNYMHLDLLPTAPGMFAISIQQCSFEQPSVERAGPRCEVEINDAL